jgi:hypothetical protein
MPVNYALTEVAVIMLAGSAVHRLTACCYVAMTIINQTANNNGFSNNMIEKLNYKILQKAPTLQTTQNYLNIKWIKFTHFNPIIT